MRSSTSFSKRKRGARRASTGRRSTDISRCTPTATRSVTPKMRAGPWKSCSLGAALPAGSPPGPLRFCGRADAGAASMNERRRLLTSGAALFLVFACDACRRSESRQGDGSSPPRRIVSLSPSTTEALFALGAGERVVGRSRFCNYPPEVAKIPSVGGYVDASLEVILALSPDLVVGARGPAGPGLVEKLGALGIPTFFPATESMAQIDEMIEALGDRLGLA